MSLSQQFAILNSSNQCDVAHFVIYEQSIVISVFHTFSSIPALITIIINKILARFNAADRCILSVLCTTDWCWCERLLIHCSSSGLLRKNRTQKQHLSAYSQFGRRFIEMNTKRGEKPSFFLLCFLLFIGSAFPSLAPSVLSIFLSLSLCLDGWQRVAACCGQANYLHNYDLPLNHMILYLGVGN